MSLVDTGLCKQKGKLWSFVLYDFERFYIQPVTRKLCNSITKESAPSVKFRSSVHAARQDLTSMV